MGQANGGSQGWLTSGRLRVGLGLLVLLVSLGPGDVWWLTPAYAQPTFQVIPCPVPQMDPPVTQLPVRSQVRYPNGPMRGPDGRALPMLQELTAEQLAELTQPAHTAEAQSSAPNKILNFNQVVQQDIQPVTKVVVDGQAFCNAGPIAPGDLVAFLNLVGIMATAVQVTNTTMEQILTGTTVETETVTEVVTSPDAVIIGDPDGDPCGIIVIAGSVDIITTVTETTTQLIADQTTLTVALVVAIPTVPEWGLVLLVLSLLTVATWQLAGQPVFCGAGPRGSVALRQQRHHWLTSLLVGQGVAVAGLLGYALFRPLVPHDGVGTLLAGLLLGAMGEAYRRSR